MSAQAAVIDYIPSPDDQGGMLMPMIDLGAASVAIIPPSGGVLPTLHSLEYWNPGDEFDPVSAWYSTLNTSSGNAQRFTSRYGFMFMDMGGNLPLDQSIALRLISKSPELQIWNYGKSANRFESVLETANSQILWDGTMWHPVITLDNSAMTGVYTATFEAFVADAPFTSGTGFVDYSASALAAAQNSAFTPAQFILTWNAAPIPEPSSLLFFVGASVFFITRKKS
ncbi:MAG: hypothetical protein ACK5NG_02645 [Chthoniobacterales bacterium]